MNAERAVEQRLGGSGAHRDREAASELAKHGKIPGAVHAARSLLEFYADPSSPAHKPELASGKRLILYCGSGGRSALGGKVLKDLGYGEVYNLGAFKDWADGGGSIER